MAEPLKGIKKYQELARKYALLFGAASLAGGIVGYLISFLITPVYQADVKVRLDTAKFLALVAGSLNPVFVADPLQTQIRMARSRTVALLAADSLRLACQIEGKNLNLQVEFVQVPEWTRDRELELRFKSEREFDIYRDKKPWGHGRLGDTLRVDGALLVLDGQGRPGAKARVVLLSPSSLADYVLDKITVNLEGSSEIMTIKAKDPDPEMSARLANQVARAYIHYTITEANREARAAREFLEAQADKLERELDSLESILAAKQKKYGIYDPESQNRVLSELMGEVERQRLLNQMRLRTYARMLPDTQRLRPLYDSTVVEEIAATLRGLNAERAKLLATYKPDHPAVKAIDRQIAETESLLTLAIAAQSRGELELLDSVYTAYQVKLRGIPPKLIEVARLQKRVEVGREVYNQILSQLYEARVAEARNLGWASIMDSAMVPTEPIYPKKSINALLGLVLGLVLASLAAYLLEAVDVSVRSRAEVEELLGVPVGAIIPRVRNGEGARALLSESFRFLGLALEMLNIKKKLIIITSSVQSEGKSFIAQGLASALAAMGRKVLLVDGDLRRPVLHQRFGLPQAPGLSDLVVGRAEIQRATREVEGLSVLTGGTAPPNPPALMESEAMAAVLDELLRKYEYVIVDSAPVLPVVDTVTLAKHGPGVIMVVRYGKTRRDDLSEAKERLRAAGIPILSAILNDVPLRLRHYMSKYYKIRRKIGPFKL